MVNKLYRINARKVILSYFYSRFVSEEVEKYLKNEIEDNESNEKEKGKVTFVDSVGRTLTEEELKIIEDIYMKYSMLNNVEINIKDFKLYTDDSFEEDIDYIINNFFKIEKHKGIDLDYVFKVGKNFSIYKDEVKLKVDDLAKSFKFEEMDIIDRAIFLLGYIEYKEINTPKEIVLNEMIELAKRYGDEGSYKLINGIGHYLLSG